MRFMEGRDYKEESGLAQICFIGFCFFFFVRKCKGGATDISLESQGRVG